MHVIIIGGGISGLSPALSLHQIGISCRVYDAVPVLSPLGYGINLQTAEERAPEGFGHIHDVLSQQELEDTAVGFKKAAGFDLETVNSRESFVEPLGP